MNPTLRAVLVAALAGLAGGCTTWVDVKKVEPSSKEPGLRYSLPVPFLLVQPQPDGSASYTWIYLPDTDKTYAINQHAFLSKFTFDVTLANNLLSKVNAQTDNTAVVAKLFDSAQSTFAAREQAAAGKKKDAATALAAAKTAVASAQLAYNQAQAEYKAISAPGSGYTDDQKRAAALKVLDTEIALKQANAALASLTKGGDGAANAPAALPQQWGPVLFRVMPDGDKGIKLVAVNPQVKYDTVSPPTAAPTPSSYTLMLASTTLSHSTTPLTVSAQISVAVISVDASTTTVVSGTGNTVTDRPKLSLSDDKKTLTATFANGLGPGDYVLTPAFVLVADQPAVSKASVTFKVQ